MWPALDRPRTPWSAVDADGAPSRSGGMLVAWWAPDRTATGNCVLAGSRAWTGHERPVSVALPGAWCARHHMCQHPRAPGAPRGFARGCMHGPGERDAIARLGSAGGVVVLDALMIPWPASGPPG